ncbi:MAG: aminoacetone oxidase family FAD-binding enzyme, partial [Verrucomicrobiales bacterium VVV1]
MDLAIIGGGPAGLRAAEVAAQAGARVTLFDAKPSVGRKLLVAGRGGLNLTHGEEFDSFVERYSGPDQPDGFWRKILTEFPPEDLRQWAEGLGIQTFQQRTGRVYPVEMKAAPLLRRWIERL